MLKPENFEEKGIELIEKSCVGVANVVSLNKIKFE